MDAKQGHSSGLRNIVAGVVSFAHVFTPCHSERSEESSVTL